MQRHRIHDLHVRQGVPLPQVALRLGLSIETVSQHWSRLQKELTAEAPRKADDFVVLRERIGAMLWRTIQFTGQATGTGDSFSALRAAQDALKGDKDAEAVHAEAEGQVNAETSAPAAKGVPAAAKAAPSPLLTIHLRALEQLARLYGLSRDNCVPADAARPYATPEEIAAAARERMLDLHDRSE